MVVKGSSMSYMFERLDSTGRMESYTLYKSKRDCKENWEEFTIDNKYLFKKPQEVINVWIKHPLRRTYDKIVFAPNKFFKYNVDEYSVYNMWSGWEYEFDETIEVDMDLISNVLHHIKVVVCNGNNEMYEYILNLWKLILLGKKTGIGVGLQGRQGVGKSIILEYFGKRILGEKYFAYIQSLDDVTNKFTSLRCMKSFVLCDELDTWAGDTKTATMLKSMLTQPKTKLERKNKDPINIDDFANYAFLSNAENMLRVEGKDDRRYLIQRANEMYRKNKKYFNKLNKDLGNQPLNGFLNKNEQQRAKNIALHFFTFLMKRNVDTFDSRDIPQTEVLINMKADSTPVIISFVYALMKNIKKHNITSLYTAEIFDLYKTYCRETESKCKYQFINTFSKRLKTSFSIFKKHITHSRKGSEFRDFSN